MLSGAAAVKGSVPIGYDGAINLKAVQENNPGRLTVTDSDRKSRVNSLQPLCPHATDPSINNQFELGARTWALVSPRTNKSQSVDTMVLFSKPALIPHVRLL